jgi:DNA-binding transcriptional LysR family regulator
MLNYAQLARTDINLLLVFDLLFEERNAGRAADRLNLSPSAVSHALRRLRLLLNDPLFLPTSKGMVPTERANALAPAISDIVKRIRGVIASADAFDPATAVRRFRLGAPDGAISILVPSLVKRIELVASNIDLAVIQLLPRPGSADPEHAWRDALAELDTGRIDLAILPHRPGQARFLSTSLYPEDFVIVSRRGHPFAATPSINALASARHVLVSATGDASGFVDRLLAERGQTRRVALTVPSFFMAAAAIASSDLIGAIPRRFATEAARTFDIEIVEPPFSMGSADLQAIIPAAALLDQGIAWLVDTVAGCVARRSPASLADSCPSGIVAMVGAHQQGDVR